jgi:DnaJ-class molecular chaperone
MTLKDFGLCADPFGNLCPTCYGEGKITRPYWRQLGSMEITCPACGGTGKRGPSQTT